MRSKVTDYPALLEKLSEISEAAAREWVEKMNGRNDVCGFSWIRGLDKRTKHFKEFKKLGIVSASDTDFKVRNSFSGWQDLGLAETANRAVVDFLKENFEGFDKLWVSSVWD